MLTGNHGLVIRFQRFRCFGAAVVAAVFEVHRHGFQIGIGPVLRRIIHFFGHRPGSDIKTVGTGFQILRQVRFSPVTNPGVLIGGAYIVEGLGHCGTCHTPKNIIGGDKDSQFLQGAVIENWVASDITTNKHTGIGNWTEADLTQYLKTGANRFDIASGPMAEEVDNSSQHWTDADLKAVAVYLKDSGHDRGSKAAEPLKTDDKAMIAGKHIYADRCSACHTPDGKGQEGMFPRLADSALINQDNATSLIHVVLTGSRPVATNAAPTAPAMPSFDANLSDEDVANVLTYIRNSWGNASTAVSSSDVKDLRAELKK